jgi:hypothetical protein
VAKVASLERVAQTGGVDLQKLIRTLREAVGQEGEEGASVGETAAGGTGSPPAAEPDWVKAGRARETINADEILAAGETPLARINQIVSHLGGDEMLRVVSSFRPAPLIDALSKAGHLVFTKEVAADRFETFVRKEL